MLLYSAFGTNQNRSALQGGDILADASYLVPSLRAAVRSLFVQS